MDKNLYKNMNKIQIKHLLTKEDIDVFSTNLAESFQDYSLFEYFCNIVFRK